MHFLNIDPVLFQIGPIALRWYGLMYLFGVFIAIILLKKRALNYKIVTYDKYIEDLVFYCFLGVIIGGRFGYVLFYQLDNFLFDPLYLFMIHKGGMSFHGGILGVICALYLFSKAKKQQFLYVCDFLAPSVAIGLGLGRIGNFINAELYGRQTDMPWGVIFPTDPQALTRHPSQLYQAFLEGIVLFFIVWIFAKKQRNLGQVSAVFFIFYSLFRILVEFTREPDAHLGLYAGFISMGQILSLPMLFLGIYLYLKPAKLTG